MVKKLYKHEIQAYLRVWIPMQIVLLGIALLGRLIQLFESEAVVYNVINTSSIVAYVLAAVVAVGFVFVFSVVRFYKNLFTAEGYLSFTLPVTPTQHILVKLFTALLFYAATIVTVLLSVCVITMGDVLCEVGKAIGYLWRVLWKEVGVHFGFYIAELTVLLAVLLMTTVLLYYACMSVGQLSNKNRVLMAVVAYFVYYLITQVFGTILIVIGFVMPDAWITFFENYWIYHTKEALHWIFGGLIVWEGLLGTAYAFVTRHILRRRLNLE